MPLSYCSVIGSIKYVNKINVHFLHINKQVITKKFAWGKIDVVMQMTLQIAIQVTKMNQLASYS